MMVVLKANIIKFTFSRYIVKSKNVDALQNQLDRVPKTYFVIIN
jgi:hypothetical protein